MCSFCRSGWDNGNLSRCAILELYHRSSCSLHNTVISTRVGSFHKEIPPPIFRIKEVDWSLLIRCVLATIDLSRRLTKTRSARKGIEPSREAVTSEKSAPAIVCLACGLWRKMLAGTSPLGSFCATTMIHYLFSVNFEQCSCKCVRMCESCGAVYGKHN